jgi:hypothetical protein
MKWIHWTVELAGINEILGGMPKSEDLIVGQMASKEIRLRAKAMGRDPERIIADNLNTIGIEAGMEEIVDEEKMSCGFRRSADQALCLGAHQIQSLLLDAMTTLRLGQKVRGLKDTLARGTLVTQPGTEPGLLKMQGDSAGTVEQPTGTLEWGSQVTDRSGSRAILRRYDYVKPWRLAFTVKYPDTGILTVEIWKDLWEMSEVQGLGAARPRGYGKFSVVSNIKSKEN